ncbi:unnamed protein product [Rhizophagus irregularis]|nr:unnamed protein product [Rhizophagus irregularis]
MERWRVKDEMFLQLSTTAATLWKSWGHNTPFESSIDWWLTIFDEDYIRNLVSMATVNNDDEYDDLPDDSDLTDLNDEEGSDANSSQNTNAIAQLNIEETVDLLPWVVIDPTFIPQCTRSFSDDDSESDFDVADLVKK